METHFLFPFCPQNTPIYGQTTPMINILDSVLDLDSSRAQIVVADRG